VNIRLVQLVMKAPSSAQLSLVRSMAHYGARKVGWQRGEDGRLVRVSQVEFHQGREMKLCHLS
jgi:hypothetical protein